MVGDQLQFFVTWEQDGWDDWYLAMDLFAKWHLTPPYDNPAALLRLLQSKETNTARNSGLLQASYDLSLEAPR